MSTFCYPDLLKKKKCSSPAAFIMEFMDRFYRLFPKRVVALDFLWSFYFLDFDYLARFPCCLVIISDQLMQHVLPFSIAFIRVACEWHGREWVKLRLQWKVIAYQGEEKVWGKKNPESIYSRNSKRNFLKKIFFLNVSWLVLCPFCSGIKHTIFTWGILSWENWQEIE